jgi:hypothetical protein
MTRFLSIFVALGFASLGFGQPPQVGVGEQNANIEWCYVDERVSCVDAVVMLFIETEPDYAVVFCGCDFDGLNWNCKDSNKILTKADAGVFIDYTRQHQVVAGQGDPAGAGKKSVLEGAVVDCGSKETCSPGNCVAIQVGPGPVIRSCKTVAAPDGNNLPVRSRRSNGDACQGVAGPRVPPVVAVVNEAP